MELKANLGVVRGARMGRFASIRQTLFLGIINRGCQQGGETLIGCRFVRVDRGPCPYIALHEALQGWLVCGSNDLGADWIGVPVLHAAHGRLIHSTASGQLGSFAGMHVLGLAAHLGLIDFHRAIKRAIVLVTVIDRLADALEHFPGGLLRDPDLPVQHFLERWSQMRIHCRAPDIPASTKCLEGRFGRLKPRVRRARGLPDGGRPAQLPPGPSATYASDGPGPRCRFPQPIPRSSNSPTPVVYRTRCFLI